MYYVKGKGWFEASGKPVGSMAKVQLNLARTYGFRNDRASFTRLVIESRVSGLRLQQQFRIGQAMAEKGTVPNE